MIALSAGRISRPLLILASVCCMSLGASASAGAVSNTDANAEDDLKFRDLYTMAPEDMPKDRSADAASGVASAASSEAFSEAGSTSDRSFALTPPDARSGTPRFAASAPDAGGAAPDAARAAAPDAAGMSPHKSTVAADPQPDRQLRFRDRSSDDANSLSRNLTTPAGILQWLFSTVAVLGVIFCIAFFLRRSRFVQRTVGAMQVEGQIALGPKERVVCVRAHGRRLLLGVTSNSVTLLTELETDADADTRPPLDPRSKERFFSSKTGRNHRSASAMPDDDVLQRRAARADAGRKIVENDARSFEAVLKDCAAGSSQGKDA